MMLDIGGLGILSIYRTYWVLKQSIAMRRRMNVLMIVMGVMKKGRDVNVNHPRNIPSSPVNCGKWMNRC